jgi:hypothetical protein
VPDAFRSCAESRSNEALTDQNVTLSAIDTAKTRIGLVLSLILVMHDPTGYRTILHVTTALLTSLRGSAKRIPRQEGAAWRGRPSWRSPEAEDAPQEDRSPLRDKGGSKAEKARAKPKLTDR